MKSQSPKLPRRKSDTRKKRSRFSMDRASRTRLAALLALCCLGVVLMFLTMRDTSRRGGPVPATTVQSDGGTIRVPLEQMADGKAHFFSYAAGDIAARFFVIKTGDRTYHAALDACEACYAARKGYVQRGQAVVCNECGRRYRTDEIDDGPGQCVPVSLPWQVDGADLVIATEDLTAINSRVAAAAATAPSRREGMSGGSESSGKVQAH